MTKIRLETRSGDFVAEVEIPTMMPMPEIVTWGDRHFVHTGLYTLIYSEGICHVVEA